ncbi:hypothetical protein ACIGW8_30615 [Streptomyces sioyaensis]|uniref:hypothetical protein n=1 Tax=Streptomyces sioyaensis TaxID=67364 RepID=UPI0037CF6FE0
MMAAADLLIGSVCFGVGGLGLGVQAADGYSAWQAGVGPHGTATEGLSRAAQLRTLGNSTVPSEAALALDLRHREGTLLRRRAKGREL